MWEFRHKVRTLISDMVGSRRHAWCLFPGRSTDCLPPVLGPEDWSIAMMSDRSASCYLERGET